MSIGDTRVVAQRDAMSELVVCLNSMGVYRGPDRLYLRPAFSRLRKHRFQAHIRSWDIGSESKGDTPVELAGMRFTKLVCATSH
jgi:hypothetical protein